MNSKRFFSAALVAALAFSFSVCDSPASRTTAAAESETSSAAEQLADLYTQGFTIGSISYSDGVTTANYTNEDHTEFRQAVCTMTAEQCAALFAIDTMAEDYDQQIKDILSSCPDLKIITPVLPDASEYEGFVGKTVGDMEDEGLDFAASNKEEDGTLVIDLYAYTDDDTACTLRVYPEGTEEGATYDDEAIRSLVVGKVIFWEFD